MVLEKKDIEHIADLCNLHLTPKETEDLSEILTDTLSYIELLNKLDTSAVPETYQVTGLVNVYKDDEKIESTLSSSAALSNSKNVIDNKFATKAVFNRDQ